MLFVLFLFLCVCSDCNGPRTVDASGQRIWWHRVQHLDERYTLDERYDHVVHSGTHIGDINGHWDFFCSHMIDYREHSLFLAPRSQASFLFCIYSVCVGFGLAQNKKKARPRGRR